MAVAELYTVLLIRKKKRKRKVVGETRAISFPTNDEIGQLIKEFHADRAITVKEYELLPFE